MMGENGLELHVGDIWGKAGNHFLILGERHSQVLFGSGQPEFEAWDLTSQRKKVLLFTSKPEVYTLVSCLVSHERLRQ